MYKFFHIIFLKDNFLTYGQVNLTYEKTLLFYFFYFLLLEILVNKLIQTYSGKFTSIPWAREVIILVMNWFEHREVKAVSIRIPKKSNFISFLQPPSPHKVPAPPSNEDQVLERYPALQNELVHWHGEGFLWISTVLPPFVFLAMIIIMCGDCCCGLEGAWSQW